jgi:hypothetical protein
MPDYPRSGGGPPGGAVFGKAILFAKTALAFPAEGPWTYSLTNPKLIEEMPDFADIPESGQAIEAGRPVLTFFRRSLSVRECIHNLQQTARDLDQCLWKP